MYNKKAVMDGTSSNKLTVLQNLSSNPKGPMDDEVTKKFAKNTKMGESQ